MAQPKPYVCKCINPKLKLLLKNFRLSDDIAFRFSLQSWSEWPLTTDKFTKWMNEIDKKDELINLFMDYETFGEHQWEETGIFDFMAALPAAIFKKTDFQFATPKELGKNCNLLHQFMCPTLFRGQMKKETLLHGWVTTCKRKPLRNYTYLQKKWLQ